MLRYWGSVRSAMPSSTRYQSPLAASIRRPSRISVPASVNGSACSLAPVAGERRNCTVSSLIWNACPSRSGLPSRDDVHDVEQVDRQVPVENARALQRVVKTLSLHLQNGDEVQRRPQTA